MPPPLPPSSRRMILGVVAFFGAFLVILIVVCNRFLLPAWEDLPHATLNERRLLQATSLLLLAILLLFLVAGMTLLFRLGRFFFPRNRGPRTKTTYVDVWAEAGKRVKTPDEGFLDEPPAEDSDRK